MKTLRPLLSQDYRATTRRQFTFYHSVPKSFRYSTNRPQKDERLIWPCSHSVVSNQEPLDWELGTLATRSLFRELRTFKKLRAFKQLNICLIKDTIKAFFPNDICCSRLQLWVGYLIYFKFARVYFYLMFLMDVLLQLTK